MMERRIRLLVSLVVVLSISTGGFSLAQEGVPNSLPGAVNYVLDNTNRTSDAHTCYAVAASAPHQAIDNSSWVQFNIRFAANGDEVSIYTAAVTLTQSSS